MEEELWTPIATILKLQAAEVETIRRARQTKSAWCAMVPSDYLLPIFTHSTYLLTSFLLTSDLLLTYFLLTFLLGAR